MCTCNHYPVENFRCFRPYPCILHLYYRRWPAIWIPNRGPYLSNRTVTLNGVISCSGLIYWCISWRLFCCCFFRFVCIIQVLKKHERCLRKTKPKLMIAIGEVCHPSWTKMFSWSVLQSHDNTRQNHHGEAFHPRVVMAPYHRRHM